MILSQQLTRQSCAGKVSYILLPCLQENIFVETVDGFFLSKVIIGVTLRNISRKLLTKRKECGRVMGKQEGIV